MANEKPSLPVARAALGVTAAATPTEVVTAFRHLARAVHPDVNDARNAAPRFAALVAAYEVALQAADGQSAVGADLGAGKGGPGAADPPPRRLHNLVPGRSGTKVWEGGRPLLVVGPVMVRPPSAPAADSSTPPGSGT